MRYKVQLIPSDEGFAVHALGLPGCWSQGKTEQEALENIKDAIATYLATVDDIAQRADAVVREVEVAA